MRPDHFMRQRLWCLDIETGGIDVGSAVIEVAYGPVFGDDMTVLWNLDIKPEDCEPEALEINRCFDPSRKHAPQEQGMFESDMVSRMQWDLADKVIVAANPQFDTGHLSTLISFYNNTTAPWSYRLIDIKSLAVGWAAAKGTITSMPEKGWGQKEVAAMFHCPPIPEELVHTAAGDAEQVRQIARLILG